MFVLAVVCLFCGFDSLTALTHFPRLSLSLSILSISSSHLHVRISRSRSTSLSVSILSHLQRDLYTSHPCFSLSTSLPLISILVSPSHRLYTYCDITHNPSSFPNNLQVLLFSGKLVSVFSLCLCAGGHSISSTVYSMYPYFSFLYQSFI